MALGAVPFADVTTMGNDVVVVIVLGGVPLSTPVVAFKVAQVGRPVALKVGAGVPVAVTVKLPNWVAVKVVVAALVMTGAWTTVSVKVCVAFGVAPLAAVKVMVNGDPVASGGVPLSTPVLGFRLAHEGRPVALNVGAELPVPVTVKLFAWPRVNVVLLALVMVGATTGERVCTVNLRVLPLMLKLPENPARELV